MEAIPSFTWCVAKHCKSGEIHNPGTTKARCLACKKNQCVRHGVLWHKGETCGEYEYRTNKKLKKAEEVASEQLIAQTAKSCPGCTRSIEKSYGCDHMTCEFVHVCLG